jgi:hypothetical protein
MAFQGRLVPARRMLMQKEEHNEAYVPSKGSIDFIGIFT